MSAREKSSGRKKPTYAYCRSLAKRISKFTQVVLIARSFDLASNKGSDNVGTQSELRARKPRAKAYLSDKELQVAIYLAQVRLRKKSHPDKYINIKNQTFILNEFNKFVSANAQMANSEGNQTLYVDLDKSNEALISRTLKKLSYLQLIDYERRANKSDDGRVKKIYVKFLPINQISEKIALLAAAS